MAGDWIKMRCDIFTHPKVVRMASALKADTLRTVGGLMSVWCLFDVHSENGRLDGYTTQALDDYLRWPGFSEAMKQIAWLESDDDFGLVLPRFGSHNGQSSKRRAQESDRKRLAREMSALDADKKRTREEKRREDKEAKASLRATRLEKDFEPGPEPEAEEGIDRKLEIAKFQDYWKAKSGKDAVKLDWQATWRNWARNAKRPMAAALAPITTPGRAGPDPALTKIRADDKLAVKPPADVLAKMRALTGRVQEAA